MVTYEALRRDAAVNTYITRADESLSALGFTEHSFPHVCRVAEVAGQVLNALGYDSHQIELAKIAAYLHDIGNLVNRVDHSQSGAVMAFRILDHMDMDAADVATVVTAIGNHDEGTGVPVNAVAAALIQVQDRDGLQALLDLKALDGPALAAASRAAQRVGDAQAAALVADAEYQARAAAPKRRRRYDFDF